MTKTIASRVAKGTIVEEKTQPGGNPSVGGGQDGLCAEKGGFSLRCTA